MAGLSPILTKNFKAGTAIGRHSIVKFGADDQSVALAAAAADAAFGVSTEIDAKAGEPCDVHLLGLADVVYGGVVTRGDLLTADADGKAVAATPAAAANARTIGVAMVSGVAGDIGVVNILPGRVQG